LERFLSRPLDAPVESGISVEHDGVLLVSAEGMRQGSRVEFQVRVLPYEWDFPRRNRIYVAARE
jgi:hypothetical protein